ncbi:PPR18 protein, partial [Molothrus ater]|nr:PPR18 protein [Molothrus ater]
GNTITVRPRRATGDPAGVPSGVPAGVPPGVPAGVPPGGPGGVAEPPKKRYPTAEQIQVIGGYLVLPRSCLAKGEPRHKKLQIWFSERDLERTFCYPSEGAALAAWGGPPEDPPGTPNPPGPPGTPRDPSGPPGPP